MEHDENDHVEEKKEPLSPKGDGVDSKPHDDGAVGLDEGQGSVDAGEGLKEDKASSDAAGSAPDPIPLEGTSSDPPPASMSEEDLNRSIEDELLASCVLMVQCAWRQRAAQLKSCELAISTIEKIWDPR
jgi:hypothetical protein